MAIRRAVFIVRDPQREDREYAEVLDNHPNVKFAMFKRECGESNNIHLQGVIWYAKQTRKSTAARYLAPEIMSLRTMRGSWKQAIEYVEKVETSMEGHEVMELGERPEQGKRTDIAHVVEVLKEQPQITWTELITLAPAAARYTRAFEKVKLELQPKRDWACAGEWLYGEPGVGKSRYAHETYPGAYWKVANNKWYDNYSGERVVVIDEFNEQILFNDLLRWTDRYQCLVESKGGSLQLQAERMVITSNKPPWEFYTKKTDIEKRALRRRFTVYEMLTNGERVEREWGHTLAPIFTPHTAPNNTHRTKTTLYTGYSP